MKNLLFGIIATVFMTNLSFGQNFDLMQYKPVKNQTSTIKDILFQNYLKQNSTTLNNVKYNSEITIFQLQDPNLQLIDLTLIDTKICNHLYIVFDKSINDYYTLYMNINKSLIQVYNTSFEIMYSIDTSGAHTQFNYNNNINKENYHDCFNRIQDSICDDGVGTIAWYTNPQIAICAAIYCSWKTRN